MGACITAIVHVGRGAAMIQERVPAAASPSPLPLALSAVGVWACGPHHTCTSVGEKRRAIESTAPFLHMAWRAVSHPPDRFGGLRGHPTSASGLTIQVP